MLTIDKQTLNKYSVRAEKLTEAVEKKATETIKKYVFEVTGVSLSDDGEYKIGFRYRNIAESLLRSLKKPFAPEAARTDGYL